MVSTVLINSYSSVRQEQPSNTRQVGGSNPLASTNSVSLVLMVALRSVIPAETDRNRHDTHKGILV